MLDRISMQVFNVYQQCTAHCKVTQEILFREFEMYSAVETILSSSKKQFRGCAGWLWGYLGVRGKGLYASSGKILV